MEAINNIKSFTNQELIEELNRRIDTKQIHLTGLITALKFKAKQEK
ncbi:MAG: hypothetical protein GBAus27B_000210 [Mycoplasmataceae bacterium]|nr:MAG: hypothetical protein GBAus27B_000210 [Mycoplasmataceae bacterium]